MTCRLTMSRLCKHILRLLTGGVYLAYLNSLQNVKKRHYSLWIQKNRIKIKSRNLCVYQQYDHTRAAGLPLSTVMRILWTVTCTHTKHILWFLLTLRNSDRERMVWINQLIYFYDLYYTSSNELCVYYSLNACLWVVIYEQSIKSWIKVKNILWRDYSKTDF